MHLRRTDGFTLVELLMVLVIVGILLAIAVASYLGFRNRASDAAAKQELRAALPSVYAYSTDHEGFGGMTLAAIQVYDQALTGITVLSADDGSYCLGANVEGRDWFAAGPPFSVSQSSCA